MQQPQLPSVIITYPSSDIPLQQFINRFNPDIGVVNIIQRDRIKFPYQYQVFVRTNEEIMMLLCLNHLKNLDICARKFVEFKVLAPFATK